MGDILYPLMDERTKTRLRYTYERNLEPVECPPAAQ